MENKNYYHTSDIDAAALLFDRGFEEHNEAIHPGATDIVLVINAADRFFWKTDGKGLDFVKQSVADIHKQEVLPTTYNEIEQWQK